jgi:hypothetical protein
MVRRVEEPAFPDHQDRYEHLDVPHSALDPKGGLAKYLDIGNRDEFTIRFQCLRCTHNDRFEYVVVVSLTAIVKSGLPD